jgi:hypothetical protein
MDAERTSTPTAADLPDLDTLVAVADRALRLVREAGQDMDDPASQYLVPHTGACLIAHVLACQRSTAHWDDLLAGVNNLTKLHAERIRAVEQGAMQ